MNNLDQRTLAKVMAMNPGQLLHFMAGLTPDQRDYLAIILTKAEEDPEEFKRFLDK